MANHNVSNIGELLLQEGIISDSDYKDARREQAQTGKSLSQILVDNKLITESSKVAILRKRLGVQMCDTSNLQLTALVLQQIPAAFARAKRCVPVGIDNGVLMVAMEDPCDSESIESIRVMTGMEVRACIATAGLIDAAIAEYPEQQPIPAVIKAEGPGPIWKVMKWVTLFAGLLLPIIVGFVMLIVSEGFQKTVSESVLKEGMSFFDLLIYMALSLTLWAVIVFYVHGYVFPAEEKKVED